MSPEKLASFNVTLALDARVQGCRALFLRSHVRTAWSSLYILAPRVKPEDDDISCMR